MTSWAPNSHKRANGAGIEVGFSDTDWMQAIYDLFDTDANGWEIALEDSPTTGFAVTPTAAGDDQQVNFRIDGTDIVTNLAPVGGISDTTAPSTGSPTNLSPDINFNQDIGFRSYTLFLHEWEDAFWLFQLEAGPQDWPAMPQAMLAGVHLEPHFASDKGDGITGHVIGAGSPNIGAGSASDILPNTDTDPARGGMALTGSSTWNICGARANPIDEPSSVQVGGRVQPAPVMLYKNPGDRPLGVARYLFSWYKDYYAGDIFASDDGTREAHAVYESTGSTGQFVVPQELGFNPVVHAT